MKKSIIASLAALPLVVGGGFVLMDRQDEGTGPIKADSVPALSTKAGASAGIGEFCVFPDRDFGGRFEYGGSIGFKFPNYCLKPGEFDADLADNRDVGIGGKSGIDNVVSSISNDTDITYCVYLAKNFEIGFGEMEIPPRTSYAYVGDLNNDGITSIRPKNSREAC
ncbi:peptidase inhibitor family I36 protein [Streptomyces capillispiralis]|uniref:peptidase inhibitor family I36 protein n=1 Tax=Streptomyces capillispiralis TaxID=68182 RepID=UPI0036C149F4